MEIIRANLSTHVQFNTVKGDQYRAKKHFSEDRWNHYFLFSLVPTARPQLAEIISAHVASGEMVSDLVVKKQTSFINGLICVLVGVIYCPETLTIEGDVVTKITP